MQLLKHEKQALTGFELTQLVIRKQVIGRLKLKPSTGLVLMGLVDCYNQENNIVFPSINYLQNTYGLSESTVILAIKELVNKRLILKSKAKAKKAKYSHSVYSFTNILFDLLFSPEETEKPPINFNKNHHRK